MFQKYNPFTEKKTPKELAKEAKRETRKEVRVRPCNNYCCRLLVIETNLRNLFLRAKRKQKEKVTPV